MGFLTELWAPILLSAVLVFVVSSIIHMALKYHRTDVRPIENEAAVLDAMRANNVGPGEYFFPWCNEMKDMNTPEYKEKLARGPVGHLTVTPEGGFNMGKCLGLWFGYTVLVSLFTAYIAWQGLAPGASYLHVFQMTGATAFLVYGIGSMPGSIWKGVSWKVTGKFVFDGLLYALATGGAFGWLWPSLEAAASAPAP